MRGETAEFVLPFEERCYENATSQERKRADTHGNAGKPSNLMLAIYVEYIDVFVLRLCNVSLLHVP